jgi:hypothetical protein
VGYDYSAFGNNLVATGREMSETKEDPFVGKQLAERYEVTDLLGTGSMGSSTRHGTKSSAVRWR